MITLSKLHDNEVSEVMYELADEYWPGVAQYFVKYTPAVPEPAPTAPRNGPL